MNSDSYKRIMGINTDESKIKNSIVSVCVECGKQIPSGSYANSVRKIKY